MGRGFVQYHTAATTSVAFHAASHMLASASRDGTIACWSIYRAEGALQQQTRPPERAQLAPLGELDM